MTQPVPTPTPADLIAEYVWLRDAKKAEEEKFKDFLAANYSLRMDAIEQWLLAKLNEMKTDSLSARGTGTVYKKRSVSVTVADMKEFQRHVIGAEAWELVDWRANKSIVTGIVDAGEPLPPGVNFTATQTVGIRKV